MIATDAYSWGRCDAGRSGLSVRRAALWGVAFLTAIAVTAAGFLVPAFPLWIAGLPLLAGVVAGGRAPRFVLSAAFFLCPAIIAAWGLTRLDLPFFAVWPGAFLAMAMLAALTARFGIMPVSLVLLAIPTFPAGPLIAVADALPGGDLPALVAVVAALIIIEAWPPRSFRIACAATLCAALAASHVLVPVPRPAATLWVERPAPVAITEHGAKTRLRDSLPEGSEAVLGENLFDEDDSEARAFWRHAACERNLTLWVGVRGRDGRGHMARFGPEDCGRDGAAALPIIASARYGIPGLTGTWGAMAPVSGNTAPDGPDRLFCLEALLPWAWAALPRNDRPVIVIANDRLLAPLPFHITRRKAARAIARLIGRPVLFAETGRSFLLNTTQPIGDP